MDFLRSSTAILERESLARGPSIVARSQDALLCPVDHLASPAHHLLILLATCTTPWLDTVSRIISLCNLHIEYGHCLCRMASRHPTIPPRHTEVYKITQLETRRRPGIMLSTYLSLLIVVSGRVSAQSSPYGQCGGTGWTGSTTCTSGYVQSIIGTPA